jgi:hypothetical protein
MEKERIDAARDVVEEGMKRTADVARKTTDAAIKLGGEVVEVVQSTMHTATERFNELRETQRIDQQIKTLQRERDRCALMIADLVVRMFDNNAFADALLRPEYNQIKEIDAQIAALKVERQQLGKADKAGEEADALAPDGTVEPPAPEEGASAADLPVQE